MALKKKGERLMNITKNREENKLTVTVEGKIDSVTAPEFEEFIKEIGNSDEMKKELEAEGLFNPSHKKPIPKIYLPPGCACCCLLRNV